MRPIIAVSFATLLLAACSDDDQKNDDDGTCVNCVCVNCTNDGDGDQVDNGDGDALPTDDAPGPVLLDQAPFYKTQSQQNVTVQGDALCTTAGDVTGDGNIDLIAGSSVEVALMKGAANGIVGAALTPSGSTHGIRAVALARLDANESLDLLASRADGLGTEIYLNTGSAAAPFATFTSTLSFLAMLTMDMDGDGDIDVVGTTPNNTVQVAGNNGAGVFAIPLANAYPAGYQPNALVAGDLDADGHIDIVTANHGASSLAILMGTGGALDAAFEPTVYLATHEGPTSAAIADFTGDGKADILVVHDGAGFVSVYPGKGDGAFGDVIDTATGGGHRAVAVVSFNGDARPDLYVAGAAGVHPAFLAGRGNGTFLFAQRHPTSSAPGTYEGFGLATPDLDKNGVPDFVSPIETGPDDSLGVTLMVNPPN